MSLIIENGDCLELMKSLPDNSVDLFICDLPYGETNCKWDSKIDLEEFWEQFRRLRKSKRTACIHFCSTKFGYTLIKSWEGGYKMDMVWKKRNKTGGLQSRNRPMRNHEMVYFFYDQAPKYNRDKYHKRIVAQPKIVKDDNAHCGKVPADQSFKLERLNQKTFDPKLPASVMEEKYTKEYMENKQKCVGTGGSEFQGIFTEKNRKEWSKKNGPFEPPNPASVVEEEEKPKRKSIKDRKGMCEKSDIYSKENQTASSFEPPNPASVVEENAESNKVWGYDKPNTFTSCPISKDGTNQNFKPKLPTSVVIPAEDEPVSMFESTKVFIGKRHHQTEKPQDILEFFIKYWTDEGDTILDPTMGSGSTGVACNKLKRNFIGFELDETIFKVAEKRVNTKVI